MRILIAAAGSHGDVLPFVALSREFARRGFEVVFHANPVFRSYVEDASVSFVPISTEGAYRTLFRETPERHPVRSFQRVAAELATTCPAYYEAMKGGIKHGQTLAIGSSLMFAHRLLRETDGVPCATIHLAPSVFRSNLHPPRLAERWIGASTPDLVKRLSWRALDAVFCDPCFTKPFNRFRESLGLPRVDGIFRSWLHEADCVVGMFPDWFATPQPDWPSEVELTGFPLYDHCQSVPLPATLEEFLLAGPPPIGFSAGTATATARGFFEESIEACRLAGQRGVLLSPFDDNVPDTRSADIIHVPYAPFSLLLPRLAAFVHHGGIGSTSQALRAGVAQLIRPTAYDQFDNSIRAVRLGVAVELLPRHYKARTVALRLSSMVTDDALCSRCRHFAERLGTNDAIGETCDVLLRCVDRPSRSSFRVAGGVPLAPKRRPNPELIGQGAPAHSHGSFAQRVRASISASAALFRGKFSPHDHPRTSMRRSLLVTALLLVAATSPCLAQSCTYEVRPVVSGNLVAHLYVPKLTSPMPVVIAVGGSEGGLSTGDANGELLAPHCIAVLALAYFKADGLPSTLDAIPLEYFRRAIDYLQTVPEVDAKRLGIVGGSRGAELALLLASMEPRIHSIVATTPSSHVWGGRTTLGSAWTLAGKDVPHLSLGLTDATPQVLRFEAALDQAGHASTPRIPVEKINGPILLISATEDAIWPSFRMSLEIESTLRDAHFPFEVRHASYRTGHGFSKETAPRIKQTIVDHFVETL